MRCGGVCLSRRAAPIQPSKFDRCDLSKWIKSVRIVFGKYSAVVFLDSTFNCRAFCCVHVWSLNDTYINMYMQDDKTATCFRCDCEHYLQSMFDGRSSSSFNTHVLNVKHWEINRLSSGIAEMSKVFHGWWVTIEPRWDSWRGWTRPLSRKNDKWIFLFSFGILHFQFVFFFFWSLSNVMRKWMYGEHVALKLKPSKSQDVGSIFGSIKLSNLPANRSEYRSRIGGTANAGTRFFFHFSFCSFV